jgi:hypothetical protein
MYVLRKQLYIEERHERSLKQRAKSLGISEADVVRQALDAAFAGDELLPIVPGHGEALRELLERAVEFSTTQVHGACASRYRRDELYEEREARWSRRS